MPSPRTGLAGSEWQGFLIVAGGIDATGAPSARVDAYDPKTGAWQRGPNLPEPVRDAAMAVLDGDLWLVGGFILQGDQSIARANTYVFRRGGSGWKPGPNLKTARGAPAMATLDDTLIVLGGQTTDGGVLETVEMLAKGADAWTEGKPLFQKRAYASAIVSGGRVVAVGGRVGGVSTANHIVESWKPGDETWRGEANTTDERASAGGDGGCVAGGENAQGAVASIECFTDRKWATRFTMATPRHGLVAVVIDGWMHLVGGGPHPGSSVNSAHEIFDLA